MYQSSSVVQSYQSGPKNKILDHSSILHPQPLPQQNMYHTNPGSYTPAMLNDAFLLEANSRRNQAMNGFQNGSGPERRIPITVLPHTTETLPAGGVPPPPPPRPVPASSYSQQNGHSQTAPLKSILVNGQQQNGGSIPGYQPIKMAARVNEVDQLADLMANKLGSPLPPPPGRAHLSGVQSALSSHGSGGSHSSGASSTGPCSTHHTYATLDNYSETASAIYESLPRYSEIRPASQLSSAGSALSSHSGGSGGPYRRPPTTSGGGGGGSPHRFVPNVFQGVERIARDAHARRNIAPKSNLIPLTANYSPQTNGYHTSGVGGVPPPPPPAPPLQYHHQQATPTQSFIKPFGSSATSPKMTCQDSPLQNGGSQRVTTSRRMPIRQSEVDKLTNLLVANLENSTDPEYFGMCHKCGGKVSGEGSGCTAMGFVYHITCFTCHICHKELRGKPFYAMDGKPYCESDYLNTLEKCSVCCRPILDRILRATGKPYHPACFTCTVCGICLDGIPFTVDATNRIYCIDDFHKKFAPRCCVCSTPIIPEPGQSETIRIVALDRSFHVQCYKCEDCGLLLSNEAEGRGCFPLDGRIFCRNCNTLRVQALTAHR